MLYECKGVVALDPDLSHVTNIEQPCPLADSFMFRQDAIKLNRHIPPPEVDHFSSMVAMPLVQRGAFEIVRHTVLGRGMKTNRAMKSAGKNSMEATIVPG